jgi:protein gp37
MGESTKIAWCNHTFNIAWGCFKVSPGCTHCYAETFAVNRAGFNVWGPPEITSRRTFGQKHWDEPLKWNRAAEKAGVRARAFASSMCDNFEDHPTVIVELRKLWPLIRATPWIDWLLLTKRYERIERSLPADWGKDGYPNVWLGVSVENQEYANLRIPALLQVPAAVHFVSYEPALGPVSFETIYTAGDDDDFVSWNVLTGQVGGSMRQRQSEFALDWIIYGGESGSGYREHDVQWARDTREQVLRARRWFESHSSVNRGPAFFYKQSSAPRTEMGIQLDGEIVREYPEVLR